MNYEQRVLSTIAANNQINKQIEEEHYILRNARAGKGRIMKMEGFKDFTLFFGDKAKQELEKKIGKEAKSRIYIEVIYDTDNCRVCTLDYFTFEDFLKIPTDWRSFKKFQKQYKK